MVFRLVLIAACLAALALPTRALGQRCDAPRVLLTVDRSSSMLGALPDGHTKWGAAVMAIGGLVAAYEGRIDFGLQPFPYPDRCAPGPVLLEPGAHTPDVVLDALGAPPPSGGNYTPMAQTLDVAAAHPALREVTRTRHLVLVTDGWQWCDPYAPSTRFTPVAAVMRLRDLGVTVHVVGFGAAVDALTLNRAAVAAGTALPGCDATLADPMAMNHCYVPANDLTGLRAALGDIARVVTEEVCDGDDDDCDGSIDEGYDVDGDLHTTCGTRDGGGTDPSLADCDDTDARVHPMATEACDGRDDDCDGEVDPGCECLDGDERACGSDVGACAFGGQRCASGRWGLCEDGVLAVAETCDGRDEDCDFAIDEDADASCGEGFACTADGCLELMRPEPDPVMPPASERVVITPPREPGANDGCACDAVGRARGLPPAAPLALLSFALAIALLRRWRAKREHRLRGERPR